MTLFPRASGTVNAPPLIGVPRGRCGYVCHVTNIAAYLVKLVFTEVRIRRDRPAWRGLCRSHKVGERLNTGEGFEWAGGALEVDSTLPLGMEKNRAGPSGAARFQGVNLS